MFGKCYLLMYFMYVDVYCENVLIVFDCGEGCWFVDCSGKCYFDGLVGLYCV